MEIPIQQPLVSTPVLTQYDSPVGINSFTVTRPSVAQLKNKSAPPSLNYPHQPSDVPPFELVTSSYNVPTVSSNTPWCGNNPGHSMGFGSIRNSIANNVPIISSSESFVRSSPQCTYYEHPVVSGNNSAPVPSAAPELALSSRHLGGFPLHDANRSHLEEAFVVPAFTPTWNHSSSRQVGTNLRTNPTIISSVPSTSCPVGINPYSSQNPVSSAPVSSVPMLSSGFNSTWINNNLICTAAGGTQSALGSTTAVPPRVGAMFVNRGGASINFNNSVPPSVSIASTQIEMPTCQPASNSANCGNPSLGYPQPSTVPVRRVPSSEQLAARQVMPRELPNFSGDPQDWPIFYSSFCNSTDACGFSDSENLTRLQRCLKGNALEAVKSRLLLPQSVPFVIDILRRLYGRPEILIHSLLQKLRAVSPPKSDNLQSQITFGLAVQNVVDHMTIANLVDHLWNPTLLHELVEKLPPQLKMQWSYHKSRCTYVNLATFSAFMSEIVVMASDVTLPTDTFVTGTKPNKAGKEKPKLYLHAEPNLKEEKPSSVTEKVKLLKESADKTCLRQKQSRNRGLFSV